MVIAVVALIIGVMMLFAGIYYIAKARGDKEGKKIYAAVTVIAAVIAIGALAKSKPCKVHCKSSLYVGA